MANNKIIYMAMCGDIIHHGHINILIEARKYGNVIVGLLSDEAIESYKAKPLLNYSQREIIVRNLKGVYDVVKQNTLSYITNLMLFMPDFVIHGDDWKKGVQEKIRNEVIDTISLWDGRLIEIPYTKNISSTLIKQYYET